MLFQLSSQSPGIQQNIVSGVQNLSIVDDKAPLISTTQTTNVPVDQTQNLPPPFLTGVPMVNPVNYNVMDNTQQQLLTSQEQIVTQPTSQQPLSQAQSVVANMAAYSSSKYDISLLILFIYLVLVCTQKKWDP